MLRDLLRQKGHKAGRSKVARLMRLMGIEALHRYFRFYNSRRPNSSLDRQSPDQFYHNALPLLVAA